VTYITVQGDTWDWISKQVYGDEKKIFPLMEVNPEHIQTVIFDAGIVLTVPDESKTRPPTATPVTPPWIGGGS